MDSGVMYTLSVQRYRLHKLRNVLLTNDTGFYGFSVLLALCRDQNEFCTINIMLKSARRL